MITEGARPHVVHTSEPLRAHPVHRRGLVLHTFPTGPSTGYGNSRNPLGLNGFRVATKFAQPLADLRREGVDISHATGNGGLTRKLSGGSARTTGPSGVQAGRRRRARPITGSGPGEDAATGDRDHRAPQARVTGGPPPVTRGRPTSVPGPSSPGRPLRAPATAGPPRRCGHRPVPRGPATDRSPRPRSSTVTLDPVTGRDPQRVPTTDRAGRSRSPPTGASAPVTGRPSARRRRSARRPVRPPRGKGGRPGRRRRRPTSKAPRAHTARGLATFVRSAGADGPFIPSPTPRRPPRHTPPPGSPTTTRPRS